MLKLLLTSVCCAWFSLAYCQEDVALPQTLRLSSADSNAMAEDLQVVIRDNSRIFLTWRPADKRFEFFTIERSCNDKGFETVAVLKQPGELGKMDWIDELPARGKNVYRVKCSSADGYQRYTKSISIAVGGNIAIRFYPNPADNVLIVRSEQPVDVVIADASGKTRISQFQVSGIQLLNISELEKGIYLIRIYNKQANTLLQDKLIKN
ncbi:MAG: T9SS type A sorting domain-containing protein [Chitinophagaceae bacterium]|nr:T9SS type A sorting domain-containing protein [Chitinophagaceae bacterium]